MASRPPSLALSGEDLTGAAAPGQSPWAIGPDTPVTPPAGIISDPNVMWLDPGLLMEPGTGFGSAQKADALGQAMEDASGFLQPRGGGGGGAPAKPVGGQGGVDAGGLVESGVDIAEKLFGGRDPGQPRREGFLSPDIIQSPWFQDAMSGKSGGSVVPPGFDPSQMQAFQLDPNVLSGLTGGGKLTPDQLDSLMSSLADSFDPFPAGASVPTAPNAIGTAGGAAASIGTLLAAIAPLIGGDAGKYLSGAGGVAQSAGSVANAASTGSMAAGAGGVGGLLAALGALIGGDAGRYLSAAGTAVSAGGGLAGLAGTGAAGAGAGGAAFASGAAIPASAVLGALSGVAAVPALGAALHPLFAEMDRPSLETRHEKRNTRATAAVMDALSKMIGDAGSPNDLLALALAGPQVGQGQVQFAHDTYGFGGDYDDPMAPEFQKAVFAASESPDALRDFISGLNIKTGITGTTEMNPALTDYYRRELAHAGGLTDVEGLFGDFKFDPSNVTRDELRDIKSRELLQPDYATGTGFSGPGHAQALADLQKRGLSRVRHRVGGGHGVDTWVPLSEHYRDSASLDPRLIAARSQEQAQQEQLQREYLTALMSM